MKIPTLVVMTSVISLWGGVAIANSLGVLDFAKELEDLTTVPIEQVVRINWEDNVVSLRSRGVGGRNFQLICPRNGTVGRVWGTDIYTDDSSICSAAVHAGLITVRRGGRVTVRMMPGEDSYRGTLRNGVTSDAYGSWDDSFIFLNSNGEPRVTRSPASRLSWRDDASQLRGRLERNFSFTCPRNGTVGRVWGTDIYTDDSSICSAAVHAGLITVRRGGRVTIRMAAGESSYSGTNRHGVNSQDYGSWDGSFTFVR
jgi:hypothetical protein